MGRMYTAPFKAVAITAQQDLWEVLAGTNKPIVIHGFQLGQTTELGDAAEEQLLLTTNRGTGSVTSGSGGSSIIPPPQGVDDSACGATIEANNTTKLAVGTGALTELENFVWNVRIPFVYWYPPECRPMVKGGDHWTLELETTPVDSITVSGTLYIEELG